MENNLLCKVELFDFLFPNGHPRIGAFIAGVYNGVGIPRRRLADEHFAKILSVR